LGGFRAKQSNRSGYAKRKLRRRERQRRRRFGLGCQRPGRRITSHDNLAAAIGRGSCRAQFGVGRIESHSSIESDLAAEVPSAIAAGISRREMSNPETTPVPSALTQESDEQTDTAIRQQPSARRMPRKPIRVTCLRPNGRYREWSACRYCPRVPTRTPPRPCFPLRATW
jgi:hypothetical protein